MGKRTNSFQRLVKRIYEAMMPVGATVEESAMLAEPTSGTRREADILVELMAVGTRLRIAVEVRGRQDRDDVEWIDGVVGKYRDIDVQKIIAVSQSGFTKAAATKARANSIDILTAKEALDTNWPAEFAKLGVAAVTRNDTSEVGFRFEPRSAEQLPPDTLVFDEADSQIGTLQELTDSLVRVHLDELAAHLRGHFLEIFKTVADLDRMLVTEKTYELHKPLFGVSPTTGEKFRIVRATARTRSQFSRSKLPVQHHQVGDALAMVGKIETVLAQPVEIIAVQQAEQPGKARVFISPTATESKGPSKGPQRKRAR